MKHVIPITFVILGLLTGCQSQEFDDQSLADVMNLSANTVQQATEIEAIRYEMLRDAALTYSSQLSFEKYAKVINQELENNQEHLNRAFNFQPLILKDDIVPPVVLEASKSISRPEFDTIIIADKTFEIFKNAYFQTSPLTWRDYLFISHGRPSLPDKSLLPQNTVEQEVWADYTQIGWDAGYEQAYTTLSGNLKQLVREYQGMVNYHRLLIQGIVTTPIVSLKEHGITTSGSTLNVNQRVLIIEKPSTFMSDAELWHSFIFFHDDVR